MRSFAELDFIARHENVVLVAKTDLRHSAPPRYIIENTLASTSKLPFAKHRSMLSPNRSNAVFYRVLLLDFKTWQSEGILINNLALPPAFTIL